jgi:hypothetical protein
VVAGIDFRTYDDSATSNFEDDDTSGLSAKHDEIRLTQGPMLGNPTAHSVRAWAGTSDPGDPQGFQGAVVIAGRMKAGLWQRPTEARPYEVG